MIKLIFKAYKETDKTFSFKISLKKEETRSANMRVSDTEIFLKKKKKKSDIDAII